jgi:Flp pilus assembly protein TadB
LPVTVIAFIALAGLGVGGVLYALFFTTIENEQKVNRRLSNIKAQSTDSASRQCRARSASRKAPSERNRSPIRLPNSTSATSSANAMRSVRP